MILMFNGGGGGTSHQVAFPDVGGPTQLALWGAGARFNVGKKLEKRWVWLRLPQTDPLIRSRR